MPTIRCGLHTACGLVRITTIDLDTWIAAVDNDRNLKRTIQVTVFDGFDGVAMHGSGGYAPARRQDIGWKIVVPTWNGVSVFDPRHLPFNKLPPPVHIEQVTDDRKTYDATSQVRLPHWYAICKSTPPMTPDRLDDS